MPRLETVGSYYGKTELPEIRKSEHLVHENLIGLELEVENFTRSPCWSRMKFWDNIQDGSLRNNGREFVLKYPLGGYSLEQAITELWYNIYESGNDFHINTRTSLHVHVDLRTFTLDQVKHFFMLYMIMEKSLYTMAGVGRDKNIYCPSTYEAYDENIAALLRCSSLNQLDDISRGWEKYTGINMSRARDLNTVEIRIHNGTLNGSVARRWVNSILTLVKEVKTPSVSLHGDINGDIDGLIGALFYRPTQSQRDNAIIDLEDGLYNVEYYTTMHRTSKTPRFSEDVPMTAPPAAPTATPDTDTVRTKNRGVWQSAYGFELQSRDDVWTLYQAFAEVGAEPSDYIWRTDMAKYLYDTQDF
jgi:hypothetical protein